MGDCKKTINVEYPDAEPCEIKSTDCVITPQAINYLGIEQGENVTLIVSKLIGSLMNARARLKDAEDTIAENTVGLLKRVKVSLTSLQVNNIGTPVEIIPTPGVGKLIKVVSAFSRINFETINFDSNKIFIAYSDGSNILEQTASFLSSTTTKIETATTANNALLENKAVEVIGTNSGSKADGTVDIYITYEVVDL